MPLLVYKENNIIKDIEFNTRQEYIDYVNKNNPERCSLEEVFAYMNKRRSSNSIESDGIK